MANPNDPLTIRASRRFQRANRPMAPPLSQVWPEHTNPLGIPQIDGQHRLLFGLLDALQDGIKDSIHNGRRNHSFTEMFSYTNYHFSSEEQLMRQSLYPEYHSHLFEHRNFVTILESLGREIDKGNMEAVTLAKFAGHWLLCHIRGSDHDFTSFLAMDAACEQARLTRGGASALA